MNLSQNARLPHLCRLRALNGAELAGRLKAHQLLILPREVHTILAVDGEYKALMRVSLSEGTLLQERPEGPISEVPYPITRQTESYEP